MNIQYKMPGNICGSAFITLQSNYLSQNWYTYANRNPESCAEKRHTEVIGWGEQAVLSLLIATVKMSIVTATSQKVIREIV